MVNSQLRYMLNNKPYIHSMHDDVTSFCIIFFNDEKKHFYFPIFSFYQNVNNLPTCLFVFQCEIRMRISKIYQIRFMGDYFEWSQYGGESIECSIVQLYLATCLYQNVITIAREINRIERCTAHTQWREITGCQRTNSIYLHQAQDRFFPFLSLLIQLWLDRYSWRNAHTKSKKNILLHCLHFYLNYEAFFLLFERSNRSQINQKRISFI